MNLFGVILMGFFAGGFIATTGAMKDTQWEGFSWKKYVRSPCIAIFWAIVIFYAFEVNDYFVLSMASAGFERVTVEIWKGFVRNKPSKFKSEDRDSGWLQQNA